MKKSKYCTHFECPYKYCKYHENYDEELEVPKFWFQETINSECCTYYLDI